MKALVLYTQMGAPAFPQNYNIYRRISMDIIALPGLAEPDAYKTWAQLRNMLFKLVNIAKVLSLQTKTDGLIKFLL